MSIERNRDASLKKIIYSWRGEGGGWGVIIDKSPDINGLRITYFGIAD
jgi:hypothetical protein